VPVENIPLMANTIVTRLPTSFYQRDARLVARELIGCRLVTNVDGLRAAGIIVETEAYLAQGDEASHSYRGETDRNRAMFLAGGHAYVYFIYGMHYCFNVVTGDAGSGQAVLIRAIIPTHGIEFMVDRRQKQRRPGTSVVLARDIANGPAKLAVAFGIGPQHNGVDLARSRDVWIEGGEAAPDHDIVITRRIGLNRSVDLLLRWRRREVEVPSGEEGG